MGDCAEHYTLNSSKLVYTLQFQNTGDSKAINIHLDDSLSTDLDINTIKILSSSDTMYTEILTGNVVRFNFDDIHLPDSVSNEAGSHGHVVFEIQPKSPIAEGAVIENKTHIYFDYNPAVITNTVFNTAVTSLPVCAPTSYDEVLIDGSIKVFPNPSSGSFTLISKITIDDFTIYDQSGRLVKAIDLSISQTSVDVQLEKAGVYFVHVKSKRTSHVLKVVVVK